MQRKYTLEERLGWFVQNLDLLIEDSDLEAEGYSVRLYFDTVDVGWSLLGIDSYNYDDEIGFITHPRFRDDRTMVHALLNDGWLGEFGLLAPHEAEFLHGLNRDFGVGRPTRHTEKRVREFLASISRENDPGEDVASLVTLSTSELLRFVRQRAKDAGDIFKLLQILKEPWPEVLKRWRDQELLRISGLVDNPYEYDSVVGTHVFQAALRALTNLRPSKGPANFADASVLALLSRAAQKHRDGTSVEVPRFLAGGDNWERTIREAKLEKEFQYTSPSGGSSGTIRDADYFLFKALYQPGKRPSTNDNYRPLFATMTEIRDLREAAARLLEARQPVTRAAIDNITIGDKTLYRLLDEIKCFSFFENVWLPASWEKEAQKLLRLLSRESQQLAQKRFRRAVESAVKVTKRDLAISVASYEKVSSLWRRIRLAARTLAEAYREVVFDRRFVRLDLGLLRFGFPERREGEISENLDRVVNGTREASDQALGWLLQVAARGALGNQIEPRDAILASGLLWLLDLDEDNVAVLRHSGEERDHYLLAMEAAVALRRRSESERVAAIAADFEESFSGTGSKREKGDLACMLGYIHYRLWHNGGGVPPWVEGERETAAPRIQPFRAKALLYSSFGADCEELPLVKHVYALNQYLFYLVEMGRGDDDERRMRAISERLLPFRERARDVWCFRYDDTLARFYHRLSREANVPEKRTLLLEVAMTFEKDAVASSAGNDRVRNYWAKLSAEFALDRPA